MADGVQTYRYLRSSSLGPGGLDLATSPGHVLHGDDLAPRFFSGFVTRPDAFADGLRAVATIAASRWTMTFEELQRFKDPVVTSNGDRLRFESFSACGGVYARLDVLGSALDGDLLDRGTTNVDVGEPLRRLLARVSPQDALHLGVGADELAVSTSAETAVERKVPLPTRWLRGFSEVHVAAAGWEPRLELRASEAARFLRSIPTDAHGTGWVQPAGRGARLSARAAPGAVAVADARRLAPVLPVLRHARVVRAYGSAVDAATTGAASGWEFDLDGLRFTVLLSPAAIRGWSGEGASLDSLDTAAPGDDDVLAALSSTLAFDARLDLDDLVTRTGGDRAAVRRGVDVLGVAGRVGFDLAEAGWFHRELPFAPDLVAALNPRLRSAADLLAASAVTRFGADSWDVRSGERTYRVRLDPASARWSCTCRWWVAHCGDRGPCKHVIAARASARSEHGKDTTVAVGSDRAARP